MRAVLVIAGLFLITGVAAAASPQPSTLERTPAPVEALAQDGGQLAWLGGDGKKCNSVHWISGGNTFVLPQPANTSMTCNWDLTEGAEQLAMASDASAALWTLHERNSDFVMFAQIGSKETKVDQLTHKNGTGWWLGGIAGGGPTLAYSSIDVEYVDPLGCASGGSCKKKVAGGVVELVVEGQKSALPNSGPALDLAVSNGRIAYIPATTVVKGAPASSASATVQVVDDSSGATISQAHPVGTPLALGLSAHVLAVLSNGPHGLRLSWYDPATGHLLGGLSVPAQTSPQLAVSDQLIVYRFGRALRAVVLTNHHVRSLGKTAAQYLGLSLDQGRLVWAENHRRSGRIRALTP